MDRLGDGLRFGPCAARNSRDRWNFYRRCRLRFYITQATKQVRNADRANNRYCNGNVVEELGKKDQRPRASELQKLRRRETEFKAWLAQKGILPEAWNSELYPPWWFWNHFSAEFLAEQRDTQRLLDI